MASTRLRPSAQSIAAFALIAVGLIALVRYSRRELGSVQKLPDGSTLELKQIAFATNLTYQHFKTENRIARLVMPIQQWFPSLRRFPYRDGSFTIGTSFGDKNLFVVTANRQSVTNWWSALRRVTVFDERGNSFDPGWDVSTLSSRWALGNYILHLPDGMVNGWWIRPFPRRGKTLGLRFYFADVTSNRSVRIVEFKFRNPAYKEYPQWVPEPMPATKTSGDVQVVLTQFRTGIPSLAAGDSNDDHTLTHKTQMALEFRQNGQSISDCTIQRVIVADATGNRWIPYEKRGPLSHSAVAWVTNTTVEFPGSLWPGENAWKLDVEFVQTGSPSQTVQFLARPEFVGTGDGNAKTSK